MNQIEMIQAMFENPKREAKMTVDMYGKPLEKGVVHFNERKQLVWKGTEQHFIIVEDSKAEFEIIEPPKKLKEMSFGEAFYYFWNTDVRSAEFKSVMTGKDFRRNELDISLEEYMGKWTLEGVYE